jgi:hypothetical protein
VARDPVAWGSNHVGKPIPEYVQGDECLFCHRNDIGPNWQKNRHGITVRKREDVPESVARAAPEAEYFLSSRSHVRYLKKDGYGKFALLDLKGADWDKERFGARCAGCHSTAVDPTTKAFSAFGLDCYTCHGAVSLEHSNDTSLIWLSKKRRSDAQAVTSICAQCHLREAKSRSTGLPYPNNFVPGDNLFQDLEVDFSNADDEKLNPGDRHVWRNVRDVVVNGQEGTTCLTCHRVHGPSGLRHRLALRAPVCFDCHQQGQPFKVTRPYTVHSALCEY